MSLQVQYRPASFKMLAGNDSLKKAIEKMLTREKPPSTFMVIGPAGCGKTTVGRIIAKGLGCHPSDFNEINTASDRSIKGIRSLLEDMKYTPLNGKKKVIMFDEAHGLLAASQEALLKGLEEPPDHVHFIICTTNPEALKDTFKRRCHIYEMSSLTSSEIIKHMRIIIQAEKIKSYPQEILDKIVEISEGSMGIALKMLDMVIDMGDDIEGSLDTLKSAGTTDEEIKPICQALVNFEMKDRTRWKRIQRLLKELKTDGESARRPILGYLQSCIINDTQDNEYFYGLIMSEFMESFAMAGKPALTLACRNACFISDEE